MTARQKHKAKKPSLPKSGVLKLSNKKLNKLAKQGKLKKAVGKKQLVNFLKRRTNQQSDDRLPEDIPLEEADYEYFGKPGRNFSFLSELAFSAEKEQKKKRKADGDLEYVEGLYEKRFKSAPCETDVKVKALLPYKSREKGLIHRTMEVEAEHDKEEEDNIEGVTESTANATDVGKMNVPLQPLTALEEVIKEELKIKETKQAIKQLASAVVVSPQENVQNLKEMLSYLRNRNPNVPLTVCKYAVSSLTDVFKDIIPGYRIRVLTDVEKKQSMKKETRELLGFEEALIKNYQHFLESLQVLTTGKSAKEKKNAQEKKKVRKSATVPVHKGLQLVCVKSLCDLLLTHPHFNFRTDIISAVLRFITHGDSELSDTVCDAVKELFVQDKNGEVSLEIVRLIGRIIKVKNFEVKPKILDTFLSLRIKEIERFDAEKLKKMTKEEKIRKFSKRERKYQKAMEHLNKELRDAAAEQDVKQKLKLNTQIINTVFLTYFRILKQARKTPLLASVLEGLAKFAHLINISFFDDLFAVMTELVTVGELPNRCSLNCIQTASKLLMGQGEALNIDPVRFYNHLYKTILQLHAGNSTEDLPIALHCLEVLISKRRRHMSEQRMLAFLKRLSTVTLQMSSDGALAILGVVRKIVTDFPKSDVLLSNDRIGSGVFMPELQEPDYCNACNTSLFELHLLKKSYHPDVRRTASDLLKRSQRQ